MPLKLDFDTMVAGAKFLYRKLPDQMQEDLRDSVKKSADVVTKLREQIPKEQKDFVKEQLAKIAEVTEKTTDDYLATLKEQWEELSQIPKKIPDGVKLYLKEKLDSFSEDKEDDSDNGKNNSTKTIKPAPGPSATRVSKEQESNLPPRASVANKSIQFTMRQQSRGQSSSKSRASGAQTLDNKNQMATSSDEGMGTSLSLEESHNLSVDETHQQTDSAKSVADGKESQQFGWALRQSASGLQSDKGIESTSNVNRNPNRLMDSGFGESEVHSSSPNLEDPQQYGWALRQSASVVEPTNGLGYVESNTLDSTEQDRRSLGKSDMNSPTDPCEADQFGWALRDSETPTTDLVIRSFSTEKESLTDYEDACEYLDGDWTVITHAEWNPEDVQTQLDSLYEDC